MTAIEHANISTWVLLALFCGPIVLMITLARRGAVLYIRRVTGLDAIKEAVGRATEMGRPMTFSIGLGDIDIVTLAALAVLEHVARLAAKLSTRVIVPIRGYEIYPVAKEVVRQAYQVEGRIDIFDPADVVFLSTDQFAYASGYVGIVHREKVASNFMFGSFAAESLILAESGHQVGAMQVAGTTDYHQVPFFITACDYTLIGEELFAASAYLTREAVKVGSLVGQDMAKAVLVFLIALGTVFATVSSVRGKDSSPQANPLTRIILQQTGQPQ